MDKEKIEREIDQLLTAIGAMGEYLGLLRETLMQNGFTRLEAVTMCTQVMVAMTINGNKKEEKNND